MAIWRDIFETYFFAARVARRKKAAIPSEPTLLALLLLASLLSYGARLPSLMSQGLEADAARGFIGAQFATSMLFGPLFFYFVALSSRFVAHLFGGHGTGATARLALFWPLLVLQPIVFIIEILKTPEESSLAQILFSMLGGAFFLYVWLTFLVVMERRDA